MCVTDRKVRQRPCDFTTRSGGPPKVRHENSGTCDLFPILSFLSAKPLKQPDGVCCLVEEAKSSTTSTGAKRSVRKHHPRCY
jgi:hypothetical protein